MDTLAQLQSQSLCHDLLVQAAEAVDLQHYEAFAACFTDDATLQRPGGAPLLGRAAILASYAQKSPDRLTQHLLCNHRVRLESEGVAESVCKVLLYVSDRHAHWMHKAAPPMPSTMWGCSKTACCSPPKAGASPSAKPGLN